MAVSDLPAAVAATLKAGATPATALEVRKIIYSHDRLTAADMELVLDVARNAGRNPPQEWTNLFSEAVTDYVVRQNTPEDYIPQAKADWLVGKLAKGGGSSSAEFAMLIDVMNSALDVPPSLSAFALREIKTAIMTGRREALSDEDRSAGVITKSDVEALRAILCAATTGSAGHVTQEEAEALFEIAHATADAKVDPSFDDLFARSVGNYLLAISLHVPSATDALHRENWLDDREHLPGFLSRIFSGEKTESYRDTLKTPLQAAEQDMAALNSEDEIARAESEKVTGSEAAWVVAHLTRDGALTSAEERLLQFLGAEAASIPPSLRALIEKARRRPRAA
jgi:hypothetical protein